MARPGTAANSRATAPWYKELILHVPYLGEFRAASVHVDGERAGLKFLCGAQAQSKLVDRLSALFHLDRRPELGDGEAEPAIESEDMRQDARQDAPRDAPRAANA